MKFEEVLPSLREGKTIRRAAWKRHQWFTSIVDRMGDYNRVARNCLGIEEILADDWEVVE